MTPQSNTRIAIGCRSIRLLLLGVALATFVISGRANTPSSHWRLIWHDEFDGDSIDETKWTTTLAWAGDDGSWRHHNSNYLSYIMDDDVVVSDGTLKLQTQRRDVMNPMGRVYHYTEGMIQSKDKFWATYGYYEIRARVPVEAGPGMWPAFWTLSNGWPPENDIGEWWTSNSRFHQGLAYRNDSGGISWDDYNTYSPLPTGFHTYGMEWGPGYEVFYVDDVVARTVTGSYVPNVPMYLILNSGVESARPPDASTVFPNSFEVDYVRVYEWSDDPVIDNTQLSLAFTTGPSSTRATIYAWSGSGVAYFDDFDLSIVKQENGAGVSRGSSGPTASRYSARRANLSDGPPSY